MSELLVVIQRLTFEWGKSARGGALASRRSHASKHAQLPNLGANKPPAALVHLLEFTDSNEFSLPRERVYEYQSLISARPAELELKLDGSVLRVMPYSSNPLGRGKITELIQGQTASFEWNERIVLEHTWRYKHTILNVGLTTPPLSARLFFKTPDHHEAKLVQMY